MIILTSKMTLPRRTRGLLARERLDALVTRVREHRVTLVKAPTGYGKTVLARSWADELAASGAHVAWLSLDSADDQPARFAFYVAAALNRACPAAGQASLDLSSMATSSSPETIISMLLNDLSEIDETVFFFIDDYQHLESPPAQEMLALLLRHAPLVCI